MQEERYDTNPIRKNTSARRAVSHKSHPAGHYLDRAVNINQECLPGNILRINWGCDLSDVCKRHLCQHSRRVVVLLTPQTRPVAYYLYVRIFTDDARFYSSPSSLLCKTYLTELLHGLPPAFPLQGSAPLPWHFRFSLDVPNNDGWDAGFGRGSEMPKCACLS